VSVWPSDVLHWSRAVQSECATDEIDTAVSKGLRVLPREIKIVNLTDRAVLRTPLEYLADKQWGIAPRVNIGK
jgi:hypothetical protein